MSHVFLAYSRDDRSIMLPLREYLDDRGLNVWTDEHLVQGNPDWERTIEQRIKTAGAMVVLLSENANREDSYVRNEIRFAEIHGIPIYPALIDGDEKTSIPASLIRYQYLNLRNRMDDTTDEVYRELARRLAEELGETLSSASPRVMNMTINIDGDVDGDVNMAGRDIINSVSIPGPVVPLLVGILVVVLLMAGVLTFSLIGNGQGGGVGPTPDEPVVESEPDTPTPTEERSVPEDEDDPQPSPTDEPTSTNTPEPTATPSPTPFVCDGALPSRLNIGDTATYNDGDTGFRLAIRTDAGREHEALAIYNADEFPEVEILSGPVCEDEPSQGNWIWWRVRSEDGTVGWAIESTTESYFLAP